VRLGDALRGKPELQRSVAASLRRGQHPQRDAVSVSAAPLRERGSEQTDLDFASGYHPTATQKAASVEVALDNTETWAVYSYLSRDSSGNIYFTAESSDVYVEKIVGCP
jgi:hypothetical protein